MALLKKLLDSGFVVLGAVVLTLAFFLVLPVIQSINQPPRDQISLQTADTAQLEPPPPEQEEPPEEEEEEEEQPPELEEQSKPMDLSELEAAMNADFATGIGGAGTIKININPGGPGSGGLDSLFDSSQLDQPARAIHQPAPSMTERMRRRAPGAVYIILLINDRGRVEHAKVTRSSDPVFEQPALSAVKRWKFEPARRGGEPVSSRLRVPITFPKGN